MSAPLGLLDRLDQRATLRPNAPAMIEVDGPTVTRRELAERARAMAHGFVAGGLSPGDRVLFGVRPSATAVTLMVGIAEAGGVIVPMVTGAGDQAFAAQMDAVRPRWVVAESALIAAGHSALMRRALTWFGGAVPSLRAIRAARYVRVGPPVPWGPATMSVARLIRGGAAIVDDAPLPRCEPDAPALIVFTSGTTAQPKGVEHSHRGLRATLDLVGSQLAITEGDTLLARELHLILPALLAGARVLVSRRMRFSAQHTVDEIERHRVTHMFAVTADFQSLVDHVGQSRRRLSATLRRVLIGAAPVRAAFLERVHDVLPAGAHVDCVYGMTEMLPVATVTLDDKLAYTGEGDLVGTPVAGVSARVSDDGELLLRGPHLFSRYLGGPVVTEHATGDLARMEAGRIVLLGRSKDMIIRREHNIYPEVHEPVIESIAGVRRCAMVGVYDDAAADERVVLVVEPEAWVTDDSFADTVRNALRDGPTRIDLAAQPDLIVLHDVPLGGRSRKVDKQALREIARARWQCESR